MVSLWLQFCWSPILTSCISLPTHFGDAQKGLLPSPPYTTIGPGFLLALYLKMQHPRQYHLHNWIRCRLKPLFLWPVVAVILNSRQDIFFLGNEEFYIPPVQTLTPEWTMGSLQHSRTLVCLISRALGVKLLVCFPSQLAGWLRWGELGGQSVTESGHSIIKMLFFFPLHYLCSYIYFCISVSFCMSGLNEKCSVHLVLSVASNVCLLWALNSAISCLNVSV